MHGPFLFHFNALMYLLFGATDYVSRIGPALAGVIVVMSPWFLRGERLLGRVGALIASVLILVSPAIFYYSRFIRHDLYALAGTAFLFIAIVRYVEKPEARWAILGGAMIGFLMTTKEVSFIVLFIFAVFLAIAIAARSAPILLGVAAVAAVLYGIGVLVLRSFGMPELPGIPWSDPNGQQIFDFVVELIQHPLVVLALGVFLLALAASLWILDRRRLPGEGWIESTVGSAETGTTSAALRELLSRRRPLWIALAAGFMIYTIFYTSLFTNLVGMASGTAGALGYWLGQHDVQRAEQPWFYYALLIPQYEFIAVLLLPVSLGWLAWMAYRGWRGRGAVRLDHRFYVRGFLVFWTLGIMAVLSAAGEKMPWLSVHIAYPMTLLAAAVVSDAVNQLVLRWRAFPGRTGRAELIYGLTVAALLTCAFLTLAWASAGPYLETDNRLLRAIRPEAADNWWLLVYWPWAALLLVTGIAIWLLGRRRALSTFLLTLTLGLIFAQVHTSWRMSYQEGDTPRDMLIYVQSTPDVTRVIGQLQDLSQDLHGDMSLEVWYDSGTQWPLNWYLRGFDQRRFFGNAITDDVNPPVVLVARENVNADMEKKLEGYTYQEYPMRWWFPEEESYRRFAYAPELNNEARQNYQDDREPPFSAVDVIASAARSIWSMHEPQQQAEIFRLVAFRDSPAPFYAYRFRVYVRDDLVRYFDDLRY